MIVGYGTIKTTVVAVFASAIDGVFRAMRLSRIWELGPWVAHLTELIIMETTHRVTVDGLLPYNKGTIGGYHAKTNCVRLENWKLYLFQYGPSTCRLCASV